MVATETPKGVAELAAGLRVAVTRLNRRLRTSSLGGVSPAQASALAMIERLGAPALSELASAEQVRPPSMTRIVDALERDGLVERRVDAIDRRCQRVTLTTQGRRALGSIRGRKTAFLEARLARLAPEERDAVARALGILTQLAGDE
jgi:DNA-binding MarR family transcriptional regulator